MALPRVGEGWISETELFYRVKKLLPPGEIVTQHGQPKWLGRQHFDIWLPDRSTAIEYHGIQHFDALEYFGGEEAFKKTQIRDEKKRALSRENGVRLIEIRYDKPVTDVELEKLLIEEV